jgi:S-adenosylmethionine:tRNA ribosyltransferase-isomerase
MTLAKIATSAEMLDFVLTPELQAGEPPEARGLARDEVRLMVSAVAENSIEHARFRDITDYLRPGDLLVINTSGTLNAALPAVRAGGDPYELHLSTRLPANLWIVEMRRPEEGKTAPFFDVIPGETFTLPAGAWVTLHTPHSDQPGRKRLWIATLHLPDDLYDYLDEHGFPIRYSYVREHWPLSYYQTVYATEPGSAEMPSAGRAFTPEIITRLVAKGVQIAPLVLHTGVASLEAHEPPFEEYYRVPVETAQAINAAHAAGRRVVAVGTTVVRALETVTTRDGTTHPGEGWTQLIITPERGLRTVDALLTGLHEPKASHLAMLLALVVRYFGGREHLALAYREAIQQGYLWHEFGDLHLILP